MDNDSKANGNSRESITVSAKTLEQALVKAAGILGATQSEIEHEVLRDNSKRGFLSLFKSGSVEIKAWLKAASTSHRGERRERRERTRGPRSDRSASPRPRHEARGNGRSDDAANLTQPASSPAEPLSAEKVAELVEELREFCAGICAGIAGEPVDVSAQVDDGRLILNISHDEIAHQISRNSKLAEAMEHLLRKKPRHLRQELPFRIFVDVSGMRKKREDDLIQMAFDLSAKVHENKRPIVLNYKSSYDRKIIHMALDKDDRVYTKSIGSGPNRKLMILPSRGVAGDEAPHVYDAE